MRAAVAEALNEKVTVYDDVEIEGPKAGEVAVAIKAAGVCHSDLSVVNGTIPWALPAVLGHEGAGEVVAVGDGVSSFAPGDRVVVSWAPWCGRCYTCRRGETNICLKYRSLFGTMEDGTTRLRHRDRDLTPAINGGTFAETAVFRENALVKVDDDVPFEIAALIGCGVLTGVGAAVNTAGVEQGEQVAVIGCGGVGLNVIQGARIAGAEAILAVDPVEAKRAAALRFGATEAVHPDDLAGAAAAMNDGAGPDVVFDVVGTAELQKVAYNTARFGGRAIMVGAAGATETTFSSLVLWWAEKQIRGCFYGSCNLERDVPRILGWWREGALDLEALVSARMGLDGVNDALDALRDGTALRSVLVP